MFLFEDSQDASHKLYVAGLVAPKNAPACAYGGVWLYQGPIRGGSEMYPWLAAKTRDQLESIISKKGFYEIRIKRVFKTWLSDEEEKIAA